MNNKFKEISKKLLNQSLIRNFIEEDYLIDDRRAEKELDMELSSNFNLYTKVYDYGQRIMKVELNLPYQVNKKDLFLDTFKVIAENKLNKNTVEKGERKINNIYIKGNSKTGNIVFLELESSLNAPYSSTLFFDEKHFKNKLFDIRYRIEQIKVIGDNKKIDKFNQGLFIDEKIDLFTKGKSSSGMNYSDFQPMVQNKKHPLIIWLHGAGEGGEDQIVNITANAGASTFVSDNAQNIFNLPYILAPQTPNFWMPMITIDDMTLIGENQTDKLIDLIYEYIEFHERIDKNRIYIGGASMGGYQTWEAIFKAPELFAAAFPICASYDVPKEQMYNVLDLPIWIIHSREDSIIPFEWSKKAYENLHALGGIVNFTEYKNVKIGNEDYENHAVWVYVLNNLPTTKDGVPIFEWLSNQTKKDK